MEKMQIAYNKRFAFFVLDNIGGLLKTFFVKKFAHSINI